MKVLSVHLYPNGLGLLSQVIAMTLDPMSTPHVVTWWVKVKRDSPILRCLSWQHATQMASGSLRYLPVLVSAALIAYQNTRARASITSGFDNLYQTKFSADTLVLYPGVTCTCYACQYCIFVAVSEQSFSPAPTEAEYAEYIGPALGMTFA